MGWSSNNEESRADYERDSVSAEWRPGDAPPLSAEPKKPTTALEIAVLVKAVDPILGAKLIESYAGAVAASAKLEGVDLAISRIAR